MGRLIEADALIKSIESDRNCSDMPSQWIDGVNYAIDLIELYEPTIDAVEVVRCKDCKHRPIKEDADGENCGFNLIEPNDGDGLCPCLVSDGWYSWMPKDDFYCGFGEKETDHE